MNNLEDKAGRVKLLAPVQNMKSVHALSEHADECYFGASMFNMRMHAKNIDIKNMGLIIDQAHSYGIKAYLATNILIYDNELYYLDQFMEQAADMGIDGFIVHDFATILKAKELKVPFHISTQMNISNIRSARYFEKLGAQRIVLARELSLKQISAIKKQLTTAQVETFIHGAMCTSVSGRCYFSQTICESSEFSANRGKCLQPCRNQWRVLYQDGTEFDYDGTHFINAKDLCMIEFIPRLIEAGIDVFKIEGRMRDPIYIETVSKYYRLAIDAYYNNEFTEEKTLKWKKELEKVYNRGFSTGFYFTKPTATSVNRATSGNMSSFRKKSIGRVISYYRDKRIAKIRLTSGKIRLKDEIFFEGNTMGNYQRVTVDEMYHKNRPIQETPLIEKDESNYLLTIRVPKEVKKGDRVYIYTLKD